MMLAPWLLDAWQTLAGRLAAGRLPHAILFAGDAGLGKRELALALAASIFCEKRLSDGFACGTCRACRLRTAGSHPDQIGISFELRDDGKLRSEIVIDQIRALSQRLSLSSQFGGYQVVTIDPADKMNISAGNALLKTLEEPSASSVILLVSDHAARLPATIRSRCQRIDIRAPGLPLARDWLVGRGISAGDAEAALATALGNPGRALEATGDGSMALRNECRKDLLALSTRRDNVLAIAEAWSADRPAQRLWHAAILAHSEALQLANGGESGLGLTGTGEIPKLAAWFALANRSRELLDTPLRSELVVLDLLHAWLMPRRP
jgi:DNA polymerase-3 subunit delta'